MGPITIESGLGYHQPCPEEHNLVGSDNPTVWVLWPST